MAFRPGTQTVVRQPASETHIPKSPFAQGGLEDSKYYELGDTLTAGQTKYYEVDASAFYVDLAPGVLNELFFTLDDCFPEITFAVGLFFRLRPFTRIRMRNAAAGSRTFHLIHSRNPNFLVMQFTP